MMATDEQWKRPRSCNIPCKHTLQAYLASIPCKHTLQAYLASILCKHTLQAQYFSYQFSSSLSPGRQPAAFTSLSPGRQPAAFISSRLHYRQDASQRPLSVLVFIIARTPASGLFAFHKRTFSCHSFSPLIIIASVR